jgi:hypothetical protein
VRKPDHGRGCVEYEEGVDEGEWVEGIKQKGQVIPAPIKG